jgi:hypothetical protein
MSQLGWLCLCMLYASSGAAAVQWTACAEAAFCASGCTDEGIATAATAHVHVRADLYVSISRMMGPCSRAYCLANAVNCDTGTIRGPSGAAGRKGRVRCHCQCSPHHSRLTHTQPQSEAGVLCPTLLLSPGHLRPKNHIRGGPGSTRAAGTSCCKGPCMQCPHSVGPARAAPERQCQSHRSRVPATLCRSACTP